MENLFEQEFLESLPEDVIEAVVSLCSRFLEYVDAHRTFIISRRYHECLTNYAGLSVLLKNYNITLSDVPLTLQKQKIIEGMTLNVGSIKADVQNKQDHFIYHSAKERFAATIGKGFAYVFTDGDLSRIQVLINELRDLITKKRIQLISATESPKLW